jgi:hypothetical protein
MILRSYHYFRQITDNFEITLLYRSSQISVKNNFLIEDQHLPC